MPHIPGQQHLPGMAPPAAHNWQQGGQRVGQLAVNLWNWGTFWSWIVLWFLVVSTVLIPLVALTGQPAIIALVGLVPSAGLLAVFLHPHGPSPLWGGVIAYWPDRILENEKRRVPILREGIPLGGNELRLNVRRIAGVLFAEALLAEYYALMEYVAGGADTTLVFVSFVLFITLGLGTAAQPGRLRSTGLPLVIAAVLIVSVIFALGGKSGIEAKARAIGNDDAKAAPTAETPPASTDRAFCVKIPLAGPGNWVGPIGITHHVESELAFVPGGWKYIIDGPPDLRKEGSDGEIRGFGETDLPSGATYIDGPSGEVATVKARPPDGAYVDC